jgi:hypothetical protein
MENIEHRVEELLNSAERIDIKPGGPSVHPSSTPLLRDKLAFAEPEEIGLIQSYLGIPNEELYTDSNIDLMHTLYIMAQKAEEPLYKFLVSIGNKIGGRMESGFVDKLSVYLGLLIEQENVSSAAKLLLGSRKLDKKQESEIDRIIKDLKKESRR